jgi:hypothetical protein
MSTLISCARLFLGTINSHLFIIITLNPLSLGYGLWRRISLDLSRVRVSLSHLLFSRSSGYQHESEFGDQAVLSVPHPPIHGTVSENGNHDRSIGIESASGYSQRSERFAECGGKN